MGLLQKIGWKTRKWNLKFSLLDVYLHDGDECWGFSFCEISSDYRVYSLLAIEFRLPNGAERQEVQWLNWDFLYLAKPVSNWFYDLQENVMWGYKPNWFEKLCLRIFNK